MYQFWYTPRVVFQRHIFLSHNSLSQFETMDLNRMCYPFGRRPDHPNLLHKNLYLELIKIYPPNYRNIIFPNRSRKRYIFVFKNLIKWPFNPPIQNDEASCRFWYIVLHSLLICIGRATFCKVLAATLYFW